MKQYLSKIKPFYHSEFKDFYEKLDELLNTENSYFLPEKNGTKKDLLFLTATHGDEEIGKSVMQEIWSKEARKVSHKAKESMQDYSRTHRFDWLVANEKALAEKKRFVDVDLNRSAPGNHASEKYEEKRAAQLLDYSKSYNYVIDLHGSKANTGLFTIITKLSFDDLLLAAQFDIPNIVIWLASEQRETGPLVQYMEPAIEIECGPKTDARTMKELQKNIKSFLQKYNTPVMSEDFKNKNIYMVYDKLESCDLELKDFHEVEHEGEEFYPLLVGEYDISCYKMFKLK